ncbi:helix-turn-helix transcriptional regulator [Maribacter algarum]|uniref:Helix-turn-helix transcriptional regulator n=1 Tax=Maribacter algarum (ex Zhang et al. 2020) TaxID=2578118 RepID=A0A5S3QLV7_9FLAO|nr:helix-turn-helix transcriptional regulator [Maribacter algarum]TMM58874.1 helix-turn-helix transcriptional regulator [Maribacter algarum]
MYYKICKIITQYYNFMFVLKQLRRKKKINQTDLAHAVGVSLRTIQLYEKKNANIPIKNLTKIANYFEVSIAELYSHEVNEEQDIYKLSSATSDSTLTVKKIDAKKWIVNAPLVTVKKLRDYCHETENREFLKSLPSLSFVVENIESGTYVAFEIMGNSMENGTADSIPSGAIVLAKEILQEDLEMRGKVKNPKAIIIFGENILCKEIINYDEKSKQITCHSLNTSPEYADFEIPVSEIKQLFEVIKKQTD